MAEQAPVKDLPGLRPIEAVLKEVESAVRGQNNGSPSGENVKDLRWQFDQVSAKMNQAIYNDQKDLIHDSTLKTIVTLIDILRRS